MTFLLSLVASIFFLGLIGITKSKLSGRKAPSVLQPWFDIIRLLRKGNVFSTSTSVIFQISPLVYLTSIVFALLVIPFASLPGIFDLGLDFVFLIYILAIGKFFMIIGAMDTASAFEGMGANREAFYSMLAEPVLFAVMGTMALFTSTPSLKEFYINISLMPENLFVSWLLILFIIVLLINIALAENSRLPIDDPKTHLELTMIHEVMILDYSGFDLGLIQIANALKLTLFGSLFANFFLTPQISLIANVGIFMLVQGLFAVIIGFSESFRARNKLAKNPLFLLTLLSLAILLFFMALAINGKFILT